MLISCGSSELRDRLKLEHSVILREMEIVLDDTERKG